MLVTCDKIGFRLVCRRVEPLRRWPEEAKEALLMLPQAPSGFSKYKRIKKMLVGAVGIEPTTFGLKGRCSTTELRP